MDQRSEPKRFSARHFLDFFYHADVGLAIFDDHLRYIALNPYLERVHGISAESIIGTTLQQAAGEAYSQVEPSFQSSNLHRTARSWA